MYYSYIKYFIPKSKQNLQRETIWIDTAADHYSVASKESKSDVGIELYRKSSKS